jgi:hypothetical protein
MAGYVVLTLLGVQSDLLECPIRRIRCRISATTGAGFCGTSYPAHRLLRRLQVRALGGDRCRPAGVMTSVCPILSPGSPVRLATTTGPISGRSSNVHARERVSHKPQRFLGTIGVESSGASQTPLALQLFAPSVSTPGAGARPLELPTRSAINRIASVPELARNADIKLNTRV